MLRPLHMPRRPVMSYALGQAQAANARVIASGGRLIPRVVTQAYTGVTPHTTFSITFNAPVTSADFAVGWVFTGSVAGALGPIVSAVLQPDGITVVYTTTVSEAAGNTVTAVYTAATGDIVAAGVALPDTTVSFGVAP